MNFIQESTAIFPLPQPKYLRGGRAGRDIWGQKAPRRFWNGVPGGRKPLDFTDMKHPALPERRKEGAP